MEKGLQRELTSCLDSSIKSQVEEI